MNTQTTTSPVYDSESGRWVLVFRTPGGMVGRSDDDFASEADAILHALDLAKNDARLLVMENTAAIRRQNAA